MSKPVRAIVWFVLAIGAAILIVLARGSGLTGTGILLVSGSGASVGGLVAFVYNRVLNRPTVPGWMSTTGIGVLTIVAMSLSSESLYGLLLFLLWACVPLSFGGDGLSMIEDYDSADQ